MSRYFLLTAIWIGVLLPAFGSDTIPYTLAQTESRFLQKNFALLAGKYNIDIANAFKQQAKLWANPLIGLEQNIYNQYTHKAFDMSSTGQTAVQVQQLIYLAGKRNKRIQVQKYLTEISEYQFFDLMRTLRFELANNFYGLYFTSQKRSALEKQIGPLSDLAAAYEQQWQKGNVSLKEVSRLKALLFKLETERLGLINQEGDYRAELNTLLAMPKDTMIQCVYLEQPSDWIEKSKLQDLQAEAYVHRYDLLVAQTDIKVQEAGYRLEKANRVPDVFVGYTWDRASNYIYNYHGLSLNFTLPVYDRNQNYLQVAKTRVEQSKLNYSQLSMVVENEVAKTFEKLIQINKTYGTLTGILFQNQEKLQVAIIENYQKKNITLMEFVDFYESYKDNINNFLEIKQSREITIEELNYTIGRKLND